MNEFKLKAPYKPTGDQPQAIEELVNGFRKTISNIAWSNRLR